MNNINLTVKIELEDQYDVTHYQILSPKDIQQNKVQVFPGLSGLYADNEYSKVLTEIKLKNSDKDLNLVYVVYHTRSNHTDFPHIIISKYSKYTAAPWLGQDFNISKDNCPWKECEEPKIQIDDWRDEKNKVNLILENKMPKALEIIFNDNGKQNTKKVDLPQKFIDSL